VSLINRFLATGREIRALEQRLCTMTPRDGDWSRVGAEHERLMRRQRDEIVAAVRAGVDWPTVEFALWLHGQHAGREIGSTDATPAEQLAALMRSCGADAVVTALDAARRDVVEGAAYRPA
jgi:hypothetical protein